LLDFFGVNYYDGGYRLSYCSFHHSKSLKQRHALAKSTRVLQVDASIPGEDHEVEEKWVHLLFTWGGKPFTIDIAESDRYISGTVML
jgi:hypothetical protein